MVDVRGAKDRSAIGARVSVTAADLTQMREVRSSASYLSANDLRAHFGLGNRERVDSVTVRWPSGAERTVGDVAAGQVIVVEEPEAN